MLIAVTAGIAATAMMAVLSPSAGATPAVADDNLAMTGQGPPVNWWDPYSAQNDHANCVATDVGAYTPAYDGTIYDGTRYRNDAWDSAFDVTVDGTDYVAPIATSGYPQIDWTRTTFGDQVTSKPETLSGLRVSDISAVRSKASPTMRLLVKLQNKGASKQVSDVVLSTDLGSDTDTVIQGTSSGDKTETAADRWVVSSDSDTAPSDPVDTQVIYGKGNVLKPTLEQDLNAGNDCLAPSYHVAVPGNSTRYLLVFAEMNATNKAGVKGAQARFDDAVPSELLGGVSATVRKEVLNWDLG
jgi:hypothetical protein